MKFDEQVANFHRQLNEAALGDFFRGLTTKPEKLQQVAVPSFRLENPKENLATVYQKLNIKQMLNKPAATTFDEMIDPSSGQIKEPDVLAVTLYNAFKASNDGIITLDQLIRGKTGGDKQAITYGQEVPYDTKKVGDSVITFINQKGLGKVIKMYDSYEAAQKGSTAMKTGSAIRAGVGNAIKSLGTDALNMATTKGYNEI